MYSPRSIKRLNFGAITEMLLLRGNVEMNPGPALTEEQARVDGKLLQTSTSFKEGVRLKYGSID